MSEAHIPVILSGIAGKFPESDGLDEFFAHLYNAVDMVTDCRRRWNAETFKIPDRMGQLKNLEKFDAEFFGVHSKQAENMDPRLRFLLEISHDCMVDAGINPSELSGSNTGVFVGASGEEGVECLKGNSETPSGYSLTGSLLSTFSNRLSFTFNLRGPSISLDTACSSSLLALEQALFAIRFGKCSSALVAGAQLCLDPKTTWLFTNLGMTASDGKCKAFDVTANGYVRSEAAVALYICKEDGAKRCYATILHASTNIDGYKANGFTYPSGEVQEKLMRQVYAEAEVSPHDVGYIEAHGTGTQVGDFEEINAIARVFCDGRSPDDPLLIGSVKSNMGHSEPASGLCGIAKLVFIAQTGIIPGNLYFSTPNPKIPALLDGRIKVVSCNTPFEGRIVAINSFGFGGSNVHAVLKFSSKQAELISSPQIPIVFPLSGRTPQVAVSLQKLATAENLIVAPLLHNIAQRDISGHGFRSYAIVSSPTPGAVVTLHRSEGRIKHEHRPLWFIFSGTGTQYSGMVKDIIKLHTFQKSIQKAIRVLGGNGFDLSKILFSEHDETLNDVANSSALIVAIQIALVDLLEAVGLFPDRIVGHSLGEIAAAYTDHCLTVEQALHLTLIRSQGLKNCKPGAMASVGLSWDQVLEQCPSDVFPACDNAADNVTISGNVKSISKFLLELQSKGIFAKQIQSSGMAYHSNCMNPCAEYMRKHLPIVIPDPKIQSDKWLSTSVLMTGTTPSSTILCTVDYWIHNALAPVRFREAIELLPPNAVAIEIGPHCVLQAILKRAVPSTVANIGLMDKKAANNCSHFLEALGKVYLTGLNPNFGVLYEKVKFPIGPSAPMISPVIRWDHSQSWIVPIKKETLAGGSKFQINPKNESDSFYLDHIIDGRTIFPGVGYMFLVWSAYAKRHGKKVENCPVTFENVRFERSTLISAEASTEFRVNIQTRSGDFEVLEGESTACSGRIQELGTYTRIPVDWDKDQKERARPSNFTDEFYKIARLRGYGHQGLFRAIQKSDTCGEWVEIEWGYNWVAFMDQLLQLSLMFQGNGGLVLPTRIQKSAFQPQKLLEFMKERNTVNIPARTLKDFNAVVAPGFEIRGLKGAVVPRRDQLKPPTLCAYKHLPFLSLGNDSFGFEEYLGFCIEIAMDNTSGTRFSVLEFANPTLEVPGSKLKDRFPPKFENVLWLEKNRQQGILVDSKGLSNINRKCQEQDRLPNLVIVALEDMPFVEKYLDDDSFLLCINKDGSEPAKFSQCLNGYRTVAQRPGLALYRRGDFASNTFLKAIETKSGNFDWVETVKNELINNKECSRVYLYSNSTISGLQGFLRCLRKEGYNQLRCFECLDQEFSFNFDSPSSSFQDLLSLDLVSNVYSAGAWGSFTNMPMTGVNSDFGTALLGAKAAVQITQPGDLSTLSWIESPLEIGGQGRENVLCAVSYAALNFRDIMLATGKLSKDALPGDFDSDDNVLGIEYSGILADGTPTCGMRAGNCLATSVETNDDFGAMWPVPKHWTLAEAATVPVAYGTAYYALVVKGKIREGETVLIHSGAGGVGQAAVAVALSRKCRVITTVSTAEKREFLKGRFPQLNDDCFANSRDPAVFESHVMKVSNGRGVDAVLNSLSQESLQASLRCLGRSGRFLEIGKFDLFNNSELGMEVFLRSIEFHGVLLDYLMQPGLPIAALEERKMVKELITDGIITGVITPLPFIEYAHSQLEEAFRFMASGKHMGKILIKIRDVPGASPNIPALPRTYFYPHKVYMLIGGLGGMGLEFGNWMISRGARNLVFLSRSGVRTWYQEYRVKSWQAQQGVSITISTSDVTTPEGVRSVFELAGQMGPVGGVFNLAVELKDAMLGTQTSENFEIVARAKIQSTMLLDKFTRELGHDLDYFVVFSSVTCLIGNVGQSNYGFVNSATERICMQRRAAGLHGLAIQWGPIGDVGVYHSSTGGTEMPIVGCSPQRIASVLEVMDVMLRSSEAVASSFVIESKSNQREALTEKSVVELVAHVLGIKDISKANDQYTFTSFGMDSLMGTEIRQILDRKLNAAVPADAVRNMTFAQLMQLERKNEVRATDGSKGAVSSAFSQTPLVIPQSTLLSMKSKMTDSFNLFLVHPAEGNVRMLEGLVRDIDCRVYGLECTPDVPLFSINALASHYIQGVKTVQVHGPYRLAGYSYGGAVACEMAIQLEESGETVERLVMLDGSPSIPRTLTKIFSQNRNIENETLWLLGFLVFHSTQQMEQVESELLALSTWKEKLNAVSEKLVRVYPAFAPQEIRNLGMGFVNRMKAGYNYSPAGQISCETVLIRAGQTGFDAAMGYDYGLNEICVPKVKIIVVDGHHTSFCDYPTELNIAKIINDILK